MPRLTRLSLLNVTWGVLPPLPSPRRLNAPGVPGAILRLCSLLDRISGLTAVLDMPFIAARFSAEPDREWRWNGVFIPDEADGVIMPGSIPAYN